MKHKFPSLRKLSEHYRVEHGNKFRLDHYDPANSHGIANEGQANELLEESLTQLSDMQQKLYAQQHWALLLILQGMDTSGKDGVISHVMSGVNPQGCHVCAFREPSAEELRHDYLWRASRCLPERGQIGIFNRSYYEEVLVVRVHSRALKNELLPPSLLSKKQIWKERFQDINNYESYLDRNGVIIRKFFLHLSKEEQRKRFLSRLDDPEKNWKFSQNDLNERDYWDEYCIAYEDMIRNTATSRVPWFVVPADNKWFTRLVVASVVIQTLESLHLTFPRMNDDQKKEIDSARKRLTSSKSDA